VLEILDEQSDEFITEKIKKLEEIRIAQEDALRREQE